MPFTTGHALLIGVGDYANDPTLNVHTTSNDAAELWAILTNPVMAGYPDDQVALLIDADATRQGILDALDVLAKRAKPDATVVFFFSGHGVVLANGSFALTTHDLARGPDGRIRPETVVTEAELLTRLRSIRAGKLLCLINACHSGHVGPQTLNASQGDTLGAVAPPRLTAAILATGNGRVIITACRADQVAYVGDGETTLFPNALIRALSGDGIANRRGFIGVYDLYDRVYELVTASQPGQQPELTVQGGVGPFPVALFEGDQSASLVAFDAPVAPTRSDGVRTVAKTDSIKRLQEILAGLPAGPSHSQEISGNARVGVAVAGDVAGNVTNVQGPQTNISGGVTGPVFSGTFSGPVEIGGAGDVITVGDISNSSGVAIGRGAQTSVRNVNTGGGDYAEGDITKTDQRKGIFGGTLQGAIMNMRSTLSDIQQSLGAIPNASSADQAELQRLIAELSVALQQAQSAQATDAQAVAETTKAMVDQAARPQPNKVMVQITADGLKQAARNIAAALPGVLPIAQQIAERVSALIR